VIYVISFVVTVTLFSSFLLLFLSDSAQLFLSNLDNKILTDLILAPMGALGVLGLIMVFFYPILLAFSLIKCSKKYSWVYLLFSIILIIIFLFFHYIIGFQMLFFSLAMAYISKSGAISMLIISIYILTNTIRSIINRKI
jgi:hypothetical protein